MVNPALLQAGLLAHKFSQLTGAAQFAPPPPQHQPFAHHTQAQAQDEGKASHAHSQQQCYSYLQNLVQRKNEMAQKDPNDPQLKPVLDEIAECHRRIASIQAQPGNTWT